MSGREGERCQEYEIELTDKINNTGVYSVAVTYDPIALSATYSGTLQIAPSSQASILQTISLRGVEYQDDEDEDTLPWGMLVGVSRQPIDRSNPEGVEWRLIPLGRLVEWDHDASSKRVVAADVTLNLAELLPADELTPGDYHYAVALADRAGNPSQAMATVSLALDEVTFFRTYLPLQRR